MADAKAEKPFDTGAICPILQDFS
eukprot:SAG31_NODE_18782_length_623_cov_0.690840_2_plen_23_part_01